MLVLIPEDLDSEEPDAIVSAPLDCLDALAALVNGKRMLADDFVIQQNIEVIISRLELG